MAMRGHVGGWGLVALAAGLAAIGSPPSLMARGDPPPRRRSAEERAIAYLEREVPRWSRENHCFSCHNNGDAARALIDARRRGYVIADGALAETTRFLADPARWRKNGVDAAFSDKRLARLQFAVALTEAVASGAVTDRGALVEAAREVAGDQSRDGSWPIDEAAVLGSPATYGQPLATALARRTLAGADPNRFAAEVARADHWLRNQPIRNVLEASAVLFTLGNDRRDADIQQKYLDLLRKAQSEDGGWGPFLNAPSEVFDTAVAMLALGGSRGADVDRMLRRGRAYLEASQVEDGSWPETTRPPGGESYAQRLSTTGWATLALLATGNRPYEHPARP